MTEADAYTDLALEVITHFPSTPDELREWFMDEIGTQKRPGRAQRFYCLKPIQVYRLEQACRRKVEEYNAWTYALDRAFADDLEPTDEQRVPSPDAERAA